MSLSGSAETELSLAREWLAMRIVVIGGFALALAAGVYFGVIYPQIIRPREVRNILLHRIEAVLGAEEQICTTALNDAKNFGIVPQYGRLASRRLARTEMAGRYICVGATASNRYILAVDLVCREFANPRCVSLYNVAQTNGTVLYQRQR